MSVGMELTWELERRINKAFAFILRSSPNFVYAKRRYEQLKCKDLEKNACPEDLLKKADAINHFYYFFKIDVLGKKRQQKMQEKLVIGKM